MSNHYLHVLERMEAKSNAQITRLREENARLRELLDDVFAQWDGDWPEDLVARVKAAISAERATGGL